MTPHKETYQSTIGDDTSLAPGFKPPRWLFEKMSIGFNDANKYDEFFNAEDDDETKKFLREVLQNILDAGSETAQFRFRKIHKDKLEVMDFSELVERAASIEGPVDRARIEALADEDGYIRCLEINDNGCGLGGKYLRAPRAGERPGGYQAFSGGFQNSSKINDNSGGSKGLGRSQIICASTIHSIAAFTCREDGVKLGFALALLNFNRYKDVDYRPYGQFLIDNTDAADPSVPPLEDAAAVSFLQALESDRDPSAVGTCLILPSIREDFNVESFMKCLVQEHIYTIMTGVLRINVSEGDVSYVLDKDSLLDYAADPRFGSEDLVHRIANVRKLAEARENPRDIGLVGRIERKSFPNELIEILGGELDMGTAVSVRAKFIPRERPRGNATETCEGVITFTVVHDPALKDGFCVHVRDRLSTFSGARPGYAIMVTSREDGVARLLRDSEDPSHTKWNANRSSGIWPVEKAKQIVGSFKDGGKLFLDALTLRAAQQDSNGFSSLFSMPQEAGQRSVKGSGEEKGKREAAKKPAVPLPVQDPDLFSVSMVPACGDDKQGFRLSLTEAARENLASDGIVILQAAYAVTKGNPKWDKHSVADFDFDDFEFRSRNGRVRPIGPNAIEITNMRPDFELIGLGDFNELRGVVFQYTKQSA
jgi:hypothetical protein